MSIKQKLLVAIAAAMLGLAAVTALLVGVASKRAVRFAADQAVGAAEGGLAAMERAEMAKLEATLAALEAHPGLLEAFQRRDRAAFLAAATPVLEELRRLSGITHLYAHDLDRTNFVRVHDPSRFGDRVDRATLDAASRGGTGAGKELGPNGFALRVARPWVVGGRTVGFLEVGEELGHFLDRLKVQTNDEYALLVLKRDATGARVLEEAEWRALRQRQGLPDGWADHPDYVVLDDTAKDLLTFADARLAGLRPGGQPLPEVELGGRSWARGLVPVTDASGRTVGGAVVLHDITALHEGMRRARAGILLTLLAVAVIMALVLLALVQRLVFDRLSRLTATLEDLGSRLAGGEYDVGQLAQDGPEDEIGRFEAFVGRFLRSVGGLLKELTARRMP